MLTLGPQTQLEVSEYIHDPVQQVRRMTVKLARGSVRALVGRVFTGLGSTFVVHAWRSECHCRDGLLRGMEQ